MPIAGFTIIELLVVLGIMGILLGLSIPAYNTFNSSQKYQQTRDEVVQILRDNENRATSGESAPSCTTGDSFDGYYVAVSQGLTTVSSAASCSHGGTTSYDVASTVKSYDFVSSSVTVQNISLGTSPVYILFKPVTQSVLFYTNCGASRNFSAACTPNAATSLSFKLYLDATHAYTVSVNRNGQINAQ